jgi:hypothetical protein
MHSTTFPKLPHDYEPHTAVQLVPKRVLKRKENGAYLCAGCWVADEPQTARLLRLLCAVTEQHFSANDFIVRLAWRAMHGAASAGV